MTAKIGQANSTLMRDTAILLSVGALVVIGFWGARAITSEPAPQETFQHPPSGAGDMADAMGSMANLPEDYGSLVALGNQNMDNGNYPVAAECYRRSLEINDVPDVRVDFGACLHGMGLPMRALEEFRAVLRSQPDHGIALFNIGVVMSSQQMVDSARVYYQRYLELEPNGLAAAQARALLDQPGN
ncbi:MAG: tetratricopeptide repeat protein [bacterium]